VFLKFKYEPYYDDISKVKGEVPYKGANRCTNCGKCVAACPNNARKLDFPKMSVDNKLCQSCCICVKACTTGALKIIIEK
jgi:ferredoxin